MCPSRIQVVLATYRSERFLEEQLQSILQQQLLEEWHRSHATPASAPLQILVRDDESTDQTWDLLLQMERNSSGRLLLDRGPRLGIVGNFNALLTSSDAPYVALSDADDVWTPYRLHQGMRALRQAEQKWGTSVPLLVCSDAQLCDERLQILHPSFWRHQGLHPDRCTLRHLLVQNIVQGATVLCNRALLDVALPIPPGAILHDWWLGLVAAATGHVIPLREPLLLYRQHGANSVGAPPHPLARVLFEGRTAWKAQQQQQVRTMRQAAALAQRLQQLAAAPEAQDLAAAYGGLLEKSPFNKARALIRHRLWRHGVLQKTGQLTRLLIQ
ncbi:MAG: glycosyltransferase [Chlamydiia bacterium]